MIYIFIITLKYYYIYILLLLFIFIFMFRCNYAYKLSKRWIKRQADIFFISFAKKVSTADSQ
ncbi:hypothetical protein HMPREF1860_01046 [Prevotella amnii]|uniref:Uncharacterized protein n=1 Tax=Prevotella amnii TaxID=419005 RepID=A0A134BDH6_9BACT|nr:hypothetical protein HMPREF1860_01046 [Prevotella amnii]